MKTNGICAYFPCPCRSRVFKFQRFLILVYGQNPSNLNEERTARFGILFGWSYIGKPISWHASKPEQNLGLWRKNKNKRKLNKKFAGCTRARERELFLKASLFTPLPPYLGFYLGSLQIPQGDFLWKRKETVPFVLGHHQLKDRLTEWHYYALYTALFWNIQVSRSPNVQMYSCCPLLSTTQIWVTWADCGKVRGR